MDGVHQGQQYAQTATVTYDDHHGQQPRTTVTPWTTVTTDGSHRRRGDDPPPATVDRCHGTMCYDLLPITNQSPSSTKLHTYVVIPVS